MTSPAFTAQGHLRPPSVPLVHAGRLPTCGGTLNSPRSAAEYGVAANGVEAHEAPEALRLRGGDIPHADLLRALGTGLYVSNLWYLNYSDRQACRMTGMTRFACFWVEDGRLVAPLKVMRFDDSLYRMLGSELESLDDQADWILNSGTYGGRSVETSRVPGALLSKIEDLEHENDELTHNIFTELGRNFITPFDREDIHYLASSLDDIADYIYASAKKINFYRVNPVEHDMHRFAELIHQGTIQVNKVVREMRTMKNLRMMTESLVKINSIENQADDLFDMCIEKLFDEEPDAKEVIKLREIFQVMEIATDKCEDAGNVIESIIIKYA
jgi:predicted phosphate transport protein (TIGR00153 family)